MEEIENFQGNCLYKTNVKYSLSKKEKDYISNLQYRPLSDSLFISQNVHILDNPICSTLSNLFDFYANHYIKNFLELDHSLKPLNSWVTINKQGGFHKPHRHLNTFISICFYPQVEKGGIIFETPQTIINEKTHLFFNILNSNKFNHNKFTFNLLPNDLVIFPGWVRHSGSPNNSNTDRIMIGRNYHISGKIGYSENVNELQLL